MSNGFGVAMAITGFIVGALNYVTVLKTYNDALHGEDNARLTLSFVDLALEAYVVIAVCWFIATF